MKHWYYFTRCVDNSKYSDYDGIVLYKTGIVPFFCVCQDFDNEQITFSDPFSELNSMTMSKQEAINALEEAIKWIKEE